MNVKEFAEKLDMVILTGEKGLQGEISKVYACDLLSWVMSHATKNDAWVTVLTHVNIVAVAVLLEIPCIILPEDIDIEEITLKKAMENDIAILKTHMDTYEICWRAHEILH
ncbi:MAG: AraC family transcriptional regulator [Clostridiaceae bacterium]|jgi:predicted transcriptional regulator|nr:AraC family transcriptional regulator [Clostridiaceae bacterium]